MFKCSSPYTQPDLFANFLMNMNGARQKKFADPNAWHNLFREFITSKVNEKRFSNLFSGTMGRPNASIRQLIGMMVLKESCGWSDERLFEACEFDILVMSALGMNNASDEAPCAATYYNFRRSLYEHQLKTGEDLIGEMFKELTRNQAKLFGVNGKFIRMDSKLIGSNICKSSRLQLIISVLQVFYKDLSEQPCLLFRLAEEDKKALSDLIKQKSGQIVYGLDNAGRHEMLERLGYLLLRLQELYNETDSSKYHLIVRILSEQYSIQGERLKLREISEIKSDSLQSPYDEDAAYRKKGEQKVQGYSVNVTETCNDDSVNLITDVKVEKANYSDKDFLQGAIERNEQMLGHVENVNTDGAYHSEENQAFAKNNKTTLLVANMPGKKGKYEFRIDDNKQVTVTNTETGEVQKAEEYKEGKYKIRENGKIKYFALSLVLSYLQRQQIEDFTSNELARRNNVEASIFQLSYFTRNNKTRYRGQIKHQWWAFNRCMWINLVRIKNLVGEVCPVFPEIKKIEQFVNKKSNLLTENIYFACFCLNKYLKKVIFVYYILKKLLFSYNYSLLPIKHKVNF